MLTDSLWNFCGNSPGQAITATAASTNYVDLLALGMLATGAASLAFADSANTAAFALILFILLLGLRSMMLAIMFAAENRGGWPGNFRERLFRSRSWILGVFVVVSIVVATLGVAWGG